MSKLSKQELAALDLMISEFEATGNIKAMGFPTSLVTQLVPVVTKLIPVVVDHLVGGQAAASSFISGADTNSTLRQLIDYRNNNS